VPQKHVLFRPEYFSSALGLRGYYL